MTTTRCSQVVTCASPRNDAGAAVGRDHAVLQAVGGVVGVAHRAQGDRPQPVAVAGEQLAERLGVAGDVGGEQLGVGARVRVRARRGRQLTADHHLGDLAAERAVVADGQRGQPHHDVGAAAPPASSDQPRPVGAALATGLEAVDGVGAPSAT